MTKHQNDNPYLLTENKSETIEKKLYLIYYELSI